MKKKYLVLITLLFNANCVYSTPIPSSPNSVCKSFTVAPGIEDFIYDDNSLILSSAQRRDKLPFEGNLYRFYTETNEIIKINRIQEPTDVFFNPHGISFATKKNGEQWLYVISHPHKKLASNINHSILIYKIEKNIATFIQKLENKEFLKSPNDVYALPDGTIYVTNDYFKNDLIEGLFKMKTGSVVKYNPVSNKWGIAVDKISFANGVYATNTDLYVSATLQNKLFHYKIQDNRYTLLSSMDFIGGDNLQPFMVDNKLQFIITSHIDSFSFMRHVMNKKNKAPSFVYLVDIDNSKSTLLYANNGTEISAASSAFIVVEKNKDDLRKKLYISEAIENILLKCNIE